MRQAWGPFRNKYFQQAITLLTFLSTIGIIAYLVYSQRTILLTTKWTLHWVWVLPTFLAYSLSLLFAAGIWVLIINSFGARVSVIRHFRNFCISNLSRRLPGTVWYIAYRAQFYKEEGVAIRLTSMATAVEFCVSVISAALASLVFASPTLARYPAGVAFTGILLVTCIVFLLPGVTGWLLKRMGQTEPWYNLPRILMWTGINFISWIIYGLLFFFTINMIYPIDIQYLGYVIGCFSISGLIGRAITFLPSNMGITEVSLSLLLSPIMPASMGVVLAIFYRVAMILLDITWALISIIMEKADHSVINPN